MLGNIPELDFMVVISLMTTLEGHLQIIAEDDGDIAHTFESLASLATYRC